MRQIKFRGVCFKTGKMVYGNYIGVPNSALIIVPATFSEYEHHTAKLMEYTDGNTTYHYYCKVYSVKPDSVAQLIGYDQDGNEVYEDDKLVDVDGLAVDADVALQMWELGDKFGNYKLRLEH